MSRVTKVVSVNASPESIMNYIIDVNNHPGFIEPLKDISNIQGDPKTPGTKWNWEFTMAGAELSGESETVKYVPGEVFQYRTSGEASSTFTYSVEPHEGGSRLTIDVEYEVPQNALAKIADAAVIERQNESTAEQASNNIKTILEG